MPWYLVLGSDPPPQLMEADNEESAWEQAQAQWPSVSRVVDLEHPVVRSTLQAHGYFPSEEIEEELPSPPGPLRIWVDGSSLGNPGPAGWSYVRSDGREGSGGLGVSTNNVAELTAVLEAFRSLPDETEAVLFTDSRNVLGWLQQGWKRNNPNVRAVAEKIDRLRRRKKLKVRMEYVPGHAGEEGNEKAHELAMAAAGNQ